MRKCYCDKCGEDITGKRSPITRTFKLPISFDGKAGSVELCDACVEELYDDIKEFVNGLISKELSPWDN